MIATPVSDLKPRPIKAAVLDFSDDVYVSMFWQFSDLHHKMNWLACLWRHDADPEDIWQFRVRFRHENDEKNIYGQVYRGTEEGCREVGDLMASKLRATPPKGARLTELQRVAIEACGDISEHRMTTQLEGTQLYHIDDQGRWIPISRKRGKA